MLISSWLLRDHNYNFFKIFENKHRNVDCPSCRQLEVAAIVFLFSSQNCAMCVASISVFVGASIFSDNVYVLALYVAKVCDYTD